MLISPIALNERDRQALNQLGLVGHIIAPNLFHHLSIGSAQALYPRPKVWGVEGLMEKRSDLQFSRSVDRTGQF